MKARSIILALAAALLVGTAIIPATAEAGKRENTSTVNAESDKSSGNLRHKATGNNETTTDESTPQTESGDRGRHSRSAAASESAQTDDERKAGDEEGKSKGNVSATNQNDQTGQNVSGHAKRSRGKNVATQPDSTDDTDNYASTATKE